MAKEEKHLEQEYKGSEAERIAFLEERVKRAEEAESRNYYYEKFLPLGVFECNSEGLILQANETFYYLLGIVQAKGKPVNINDFFVSDRRFEAYLKSMELGESETFGQMEMMLDDKTVIYTRITSYIRLNNRKQKVVNATLEDCTHEVILERKLNHSHRIETLGTLAGGIAHDFNTILTTINGYSELAMDELDKNLPAYDYLTKILSSVNRAEGIVNQMLTFSRQMDIEQVPVKLESLLSEVCEFMMSALPYNIALNKRFEDFDGLIFADPTQLFRVFLNIMTNSMQAMEEKGGSIDVEVSEIADNARSFAEITIKDTGTGIDKAIIDRIYEPFFTTKSPGEGTGMGLAVVYGIVSSMGGDIEVESINGLGTTFRISIPLIDENEAEYKHKATAEEDLDKKILYVDNNIYFSRTVSLALERLGYSVDLVSDMDTMNRVLENNIKIDTVFLRCSFDEKDKEEILRKIIGKEEVSRIILITIPGISTYRKVLEAGREKINMLSEPVTLRDILRSI